MKKLWKKHWNLNSLIESFETKDDLLLDQMLVKYDVIGSVAHAAMLVKIGILSRKEFDSIKVKLLEILELDAKGEFNLDQGDEDIHTKIENFLINDLGEVGKKIHTGRSRNDQVLTVLRIYSKEQMLLIWNELIILIEKFIKFADKYEFLPLPGYTHTQKAMPSSVGMWSSAFAEGLLDDLQFLKTAFLLNNQSPLGSAAGYGVPIPLDRKHTANLLGFEKVQNNSLYCQNSRGKIEGIVISALTSVLFDINKFATDVLLFTSSEFNYFSVNDELCSGSSIMPQKRNVDVAELLRSKIHLVLGNYQKVMGLSSNLISGYNRDFQDSKGPLMESFAITLDSIRIAAILINNLTPNDEILKESLSHEIFATHEAFNLVQSGNPFRSAYKAITQNGTCSKKRDIDKTLKQSNHIGGTGNLGIKQIEKELETEKTLFGEEGLKFSTAISLLLKEKEVKTS